MIWGCSEDGVEIGWGWGEEGFGQVHIERYK